MSVYYYYYYIIIILRQFPFTLSTLLLLCMLTLFFSSRFSSLCVSVQFLPHVSVCFFVTGAEHPLLQSAHWTACFQVYSWCHAWVFRGALAHCLEVILCLSQLLSFAGYEFNLLWVNIFSLWRWGIYIFYTHTFIIICQFGDAHVWLFSFQVVVVPLLEVSKVDCPLGLLVRCRGADWAPLRPPGKALASPTVSVPHPPASRQRLNISVLYQLFRAGRTILTNSTSL